MNSNSLADTQASLNLLVHFKANTTGRQLLPKSTHSSALHIQELWTLASQLSCLLIHQYGKSAKQNTAGRHHKLVVLSLLIYMASA